MASKAPARARRAPASNWRTLLLTPDIFKWVVSSIVLPLIIWAFTSGWTAIVNAQTEKAKAEEKLLESERADIAQMTPLIPHLSAKEDSRERLLALKILNALKQARGANFAIDAVLEAANKQGDELLQKRETRAAGLAIKEAASAPTVTIPTKEIEKGTAAPAAATNLAVKPDRAYIQIYSDTQRPFAERLRASLRDQGVPVPGIDNVLKTNATNADVRTYAQKGTIGVRFYHDRDRAAAESVAALIRSLAPDWPAPVVQHLGGVKNSGAAVVEIWLPCGPTEGCMR